MLMNKISIIMSTYNESLEWLKEAINSILNQTYSEFEFIIVLDNPYNQDIEKLVKEYARQDLRIKVIKNERNIGLAESLNCALDYCNGNYIARMDADDIAYKDRLMKQLKYMEENDIDILGGAIQLIDEEEAVITKKVKMPISNKEIVKRLNVSNCLAHPTWMIKKEVYTTLNGYRNIHTCEDYDFLLRAKNKGYKFGNLNETILRYRMTRNSISRANALKQYYTMKYLQKHIQNIEQITKEEIEQYVNLFNTNKKSQQYSKSNALFTLGAARLEQKKYVSGVFNILKAILNSWQFTNKIVRMIWCMKIR